MKIFILFIITFVSGFLENVVSNANSLPYEVIFNFGDSISDSGNVATHYPILLRNSPYGSTYFKHPSGRISNGRLIIDFIGIWVAILPAYLSITEGQDIKKGKLVPSLCKSKEGFTKSPLITFLSNCDSFFKNSLFLVGEIDGNDINAIIPYKNITKLREMKLIEAGVVELVIPGNFPICCIFKNDYDQFGCLTIYNTFIEYYNEQLKKVIYTLRESNAHIKITYFDYYGAAKRLFQAPQQYGFSSSQIETLRACCGKGEPYNFNSYKCCESIASTDGPHFTKAAYRQIAKGLVEGLFANPSLKSPPFKIA
ncbi:GDSL esterase/lipase, partial [Mucuna pruriens]